MPRCSTTVIGLLAAVPSTNGIHDQLRQYGFITNFDISPADARSSVRQMYVDFGIVDFQFYDAFFEYSQPMPKDVNESGWVSKPSRCFTAFPRYVQKETVIAYADEINKLPGKKGRSWLYVQAVAADEPASELSSNFTPYLYKSGDHIAWTFDKKCLYAYRLSPAWADRMVEMWAPVARELGFDGIHWDQLGRVSDDPDQNAEMAASIPTFLKRTGRRLRDEWGLDQTFNFVDGFGWHPSLYYGDDGLNVVAFPYWECWNDASEWIFWSMFNFSAQPENDGHHPGRSLRSPSPGAQAVFVRYPDPACCGNDAASTVEANILARWSRATSSCNTYLLVGDGQRHLLNGYFPDNAALNEAVHASLAKLPTPAACEHRGQHAIEPPISRAAEEVLPEPNTSCSNRSCECPLITLHDTTARRFLGENRSPRDDTAVDWQVVLVVFGYLLVGTMGVLLGVFLALKVPQSSELELMAPNAAETEDEAAHGEASFMLLTNWKALCLRRMTNCKAPSSYTEVH